MVLQALLAQLPLRLMTCLHHVGTLQAEKRSAFTHEGLAGLSVSEVPKAWQRIARLGGDTHTLSNSQGCFIDHHALSDELWAQIYAWGCDAGYLVPHTYWAFEYYDDEMEDTVRFQHDSRNEAEAEAIGEHDVFAVQGFIGTDAFARIVGEKQRNDATLIVTVLAGEFAHIDGVYWADVLDVVRYSAPRALILNQRLPRWQVTRCPHGL